MPSTPRHLPCFYFKKESSNKQFLKSSRATSNNNIMLNQTKFDEQTLIINHLEAGNLNFPYALTIWNLWKKLHQHRWLTDHCDDDG